ncbi:hypothetical protein [Desulfovibrio subterraneus]|uniref:Phage tail length tape-measure protein n=1 Tax=Desulfovibrio subterraneus TaxID=2718620 RepID=A0A7J0BJQ3_9BACT|nr:hypothetical protein [Desulfovibrio subterraneus]GFM34023.1 hypothetical protein DSM101010T_23880 [Desulfovibrio subterraneus]
MADKRKYSAVIEVGAAVAGSMRTAMRTVRGDLSGVGDSIRDLKEKQDKLNAYAPDGVRKAGREYRELKREAAALRKEFESAEKPTAAMKRAVDQAERAAAKAERTYTTKREALDKLGNELSQAGVNTHRLAGEQRRLAAEMERSQRKYEAFQKALDADVGGKFRNLVGEAAKFTAVITTGAAAVGTAITMTNSMTAKQEGLAKSLGISGEYMRIWGGIASEAGLEADNVGDLIEEMSNKLGESKGLAEITPVTEALQILGLQFEELKDLKPEEQFNRIAEAAKNLDDHQKAVSAADILMGGEGNKFIGYLRTRKEGVNELLAQQKRLNLLTEEGTKGAFAYNTAMSRFTAVVGSAWQEVSGLVGGALAPLIEDMGPKLADWLRENRATIVGVGDSIKESIPKIVAFGQGLWSVMQSVGSVISWTAEKLGGFENLAIAVGMLMASKTAIAAFQFGQSLWQVGSALAPLVSMALPALSSGMLAVGAAIKAVGVALMANPLGMIITAIGLAVAGVYRLVTAWDDLKQAFSVGGVWGAVKTFFGADVPSDVPASSSAPAASVPDLPPVQRGGATTINNQTGDIHVHAAPGQDPEAIADAVARKITERQQAEGRRAMYDDASFAWG